MTSLRKKGECQNRQVLKKVSPLPPIQFLFNRSHNDGKTTAEQKI